MFKNKNSQLVVAMIVVLAIPVILNSTIFQITTPFTYKGDWLGFWGNYSGALLGAVTAYIVANSQVEKQMKINLEEQNYYRIINQLPALIRLKIEIEKCIEELTKVEKGWNEILDAHGGIIKDFGGDEGPGIEIEYLLNNDYQIDLLSPGILECIEKIEDIDLHIRLIEAYNFYEKFSEAVSFDREDAWSPVADYVQDDSGNAEIPSEIRNQIRLIMNKDQEFFIKKSRMWDDLFDNKRIEEFKSLLRCVKKEIQKIEDLRKKYDPLSTREK